MPRISRKNKARTVAAGVLTAASLTIASAAASAGGGNSVTIGTGPDFRYGSSAMSGASATVSAGDVGRNTQISLDVNGVDAPAGTHFGAHVHFDPCGATGGAAGGHYPSTDGNGAPLKNREVWLDFSVDSHGRGHAIATRGFAVIDRANRSVVIHAMGTDHDSGAAGARLACIDLDS